MANMNGRPQGVLLLGSVPLANRDEVFQAASAILGQHLRYVPDGETGERSNWIGWQFPILSQNPSLEVVSGEMSGYRQRPQLRLRAGVRAEDVRFENLGYRDAALVSYARFAELQRANKIPSTWRFQVSLPTPNATVAGFIAPEDQAAVEPAYERRLLEELDDIATHIPHDHLAIQWDVAVEFAQLEGVFPAHFAPLFEGIVERLVRLGDRVPRDAALGYHLCYGDALHQHFVEPQDAGRLVEVANAVAWGVSRPIAYVHLPVPRDRVDDAYYAPLADLKLDAETQLYLGLVHYTDGVEGARQRIRAAQRAVAAFGVATECGLGRRPPETIHDLLRLHAQIAAPIVRELAAGR